MSIFGEMMKKYNEELDRLAYNVAFVNACELLREIAKKVAQSKVVTDNLGCMLVILRVMMKMVLI